LTSVFFYNFFNNSYLTAAFVLSAAAFGAVESAFAVLPAGNCFDLI